MFKSKKLLAMILVIAMSLTLITACGDKTQAQDKPASSEENSENTASIETNEENFDGQLVFDHSMELVYAKNFKVDYYKGGYKKLTILNTSEGEKNYHQEILVIPEGMTKPENIEENTIVLQAPVSNMLISSTPTMSLLNHINKLDKVSMVTTDANRWYIDTIKEKVENGDIQYIGKYKEPDYELITAQTPQLAVFSTMLLHVPEVGEKLQEIGVNYVLDQASYESHPMARTEWMKFYGALFDCEDEVNEAFKVQDDYLKSFELDTNTDETTAIFYITSKGTLYARKGGDYMAEMLNLAGGNYLFKDLEPESTGSQKMTIEEFYAQAQDVDNIIYVWSLGGKPETLDDFVAKNELFEDFKAVKNGNVFCFTKDFFQASDNMGRMIKDINSVLNSDDTTDFSDIKYLFKLTN